MKLNRLVSIICALGISAACSNLRSKKSDRPQDFPATSSQGDESATEEPNPQLEAVNFTEAFSAHLAPVLQQHCTPCHATGAYPFISEDSDTAINEISRHLGTDLASSRLFQKIADTEHPPGVAATEVSEIILPALQGSLEVFFAAIAKLKTEGVPSFDNSTDITPPPPTQEQLGLREAFDRHLREPLQKNCNRCHIHTDGVQPFASSDNDTAFAAAVRLVEATAEQSRIFTKIEPGDHPPDLGSEEVKNTLFPEIVAALQAFFAEVSLDALASNSVRSLSIPIADKSSRWPILSDRGVLIFELEGGTFEPKTKVKLQIGPHSNNLAAGTNIIPSHPVSGAERTYSIGNCGQDNPQIRQAAHTVAADFNTGVAKYVFEVVGTYIDPDNGNSPVLEKGNPRQEELLNILPGNFDYLTNSNIPDNIYSANRDLPDFAGLSWRDDQLKKMIREAHQFRDNRTNPNKHPQWIDFFTRMDADLAANGDNSILKYFSFEATAAIGSARLRTRALDDSDNIDVNVHGNQAIPFQEAIDIYGQEYVRPGSVSFKFTLPAGFPMIQADQASAPIKILTLGSDVMGIRIKDLTGSQTGEFISPRNSNNTCFDFNSNDGWTQQNPRFDLEMGASYEVLVSPETQEMAADAIMLVVDVPENELADPDLDPTRLRHPIYGLVATENQQMIDILKWNFPDLPGVAVEAELISYDTFYKIQAPIFKLNEAASSNNMDVLGFTFEINGKEAVSDRSFEVNAVRPGNAIIAYGSVFIQKDQGDVADVLGLRFEKLQTVSPDVAQASLPSYEIPPPPGQVICKRLDLFVDKVMPLYTQQIVMLRQDYNDWNGQSYPTMGTPGVDDAPANDPQFYTCSQCHSSEHPFFPMPADPQELCNEALSRSNLDNPLLSYALRGARGRFEHFPLYMAFDPFDGRDLRHYTSAADNTVQTIYGPFLGRFDTYSLTELDSIVTANPSLSPAERDAVYRYLREPPKLWIQTDPVTGLPSRNQLAGETPPAGSLQSTRRLIPLDEELGDNDEAKTTRRTSVPTIDMDSRHDDIVEKWVDNFVEWIQAEKQERN
ncbi:MAG: hypothetical protein AB8G05_17230 [Oligoflexales bacterium]